jgi:hypothetical protein
MRTVDTVDTKITRSWKRIRSSSLSPFTAQRIGHAIAMPGR